MAAKPVRGCPPAASGFEPVDAEQLWDRTVAGFTAEGLTLEEAAAMFGFESVEAMQEAFTAGAFGKFDGNANGVICLKDLPHTPGIPAYVFNGADDTANAPGSP
jgi:hypothetical protein